VRNENNKRNFQFYCRSKILIEILQQQAQGDEEAEGRIICQRLLLESKTISALYIYDPFVMLLLPVNPLMIPASLTSHISTFSGVESHPEKLHT